MPREEFIQELTSGLAAPPRYFPLDAEMNRAGPSSLSETGPQLLTANELPNDALILDVRDAEAFGARHIDGAINIGLDGSFASWCGALLPFDAPIVIVAEDADAASQAVIRLARVGIERVAGYIGAMDDFRTTPLAQLTVQELRGKSPAILDVRRRAEFDESHIPGATNVPLDELPERLAEVDREHPLAVICAGGYRSSIASSILARAGFTNMMNVQGGTEEWQRQLGVVNY
jgi:rhodanese-related sulfurtransferase